MRRLSGDTHRVRKGEEGQDLLHLRFPCAAANEARKPVNFPHSRGGRKSGLRNAAGKVPPPKGEFAIAVNACMRVRRNPTISVKQREKMNEGLRKRGDLH